MNQSLEIKRIDKENKELLFEIMQLNDKITRKNIEYSNLVDLANKWYFEYKELYRKYENLEAKYDVLALALATIAPKFKEDIENDFDNGEMFSQLLSNIKRGGG